MKPTQTQNFGYLPPSTEKPKAWAGMSRPRPAMSTARRGMATFSVGMSTSCPGMSTVSRGKSTPRPEKPKVRAGMSRPCPEMSTARRRMATFFPGMSTSCPGMATWRPSQAAFSGHPVDIPTQNVDIPAHGMALVVRKGDIPGHDVDIFQKNAALPGLAEDISGHGVDTPARTGDFPGRPVPFPARAGDIAALAHARLRAPRRAADWRRIKHPVSWPGSLNPNSEVNHKERRERIEGQGFGQHSPWTISPAAPSGQMPSLCVLCDLCGYSISVFGLKTGSTKSFGQARFVSVKSERRQQRRTQFFRRHFRRPKTTPTSRRLRG